MISKMIALTLSASVAFADAGMAPVGAVTLSHMGEFHNNTGEGATASYKGHTTAIGFKKCGSGGSVYSKHTFTGTKKITFDFAGKEGGFMGYSAGTPGAHVWPIATQAYGHQHVRLETTGEWKTYTDTWTCKYTQCHIMLEDFIGSGGKCGNVYFDNFVISDPNAPEEKPEEKPDSDCANAPHGKKNLRTCWGDSAYQICPMDRQGAYDLVQKAVSKDGDQAKAYAVYQTLSMYDGSAGGVTCTKKAPPVDSATDTAVAGLEGDADTLATSDEKDEDKIRSSRAGLFGKVSSSDGVRVYVRV